MNRRRLIRAAGLMLALAPMTDRAPLRSRHTQGSPRRELGPEMAAFKQLDILVHDVSLEIGAAAKALDRCAAISSYQRMIEGCFDCHSTYKERVAAAL